MRYLMFPLTLLIFGCTSMPGNPGYISMSESKVDGTKSLYLTPAWIYSSGMKMGLFSSSHNPNRILLTAMAPGLTQIKKKNSLVFNIDGKIQKFSATENKTEYSTETGRYATNYSAKTYIVDMKFINKLIKAKKVFVKFAFLEGEFSVSSITTARPAFKTFVAKHGEFRKSLRGVANKK